MSNIYCPHCGHVMRVVRCGVMLTPIKAAIFDLIKARPGITNGELCRIVFDYKRSLTCVRQHIYQINSLLAETDYTIRGTSLAGYRLVRSPAAATAPAARAARRI